MDTLTIYDRTARVVVTCVAMGALLVGTFWGEDDHFPFGPFRMYATNEGPDKPAADTRVEGVDRTGQVILLNENNSGIRRAEVEGQLGQYLEDPTRLARIAEAYGRVNPNAPALTDVRLVIRWHGISDSRPTGTYTDETLVTWRAR